MSIKNNTTSLQEVLEILSTKASGGEQATPEITVSSNGLITATAGTKTSTHQLAFQSAKTITPNTTSQIAVYSGYYTGGDITVAGDSNLVAENIKNGVSIFGVSGTLEEGKVEYSENEDAIISGTITNCTNDRITTIGSYAFISYPKLTTVNFPACTTIGNNAFANCSKLTSANFPVCTSISTNVFKGCFPLSSLALGASLVCTLAGSNAFSSTPFTGYSSYFSGTPHIYVPASLVDAYKSATNWVYFSSYITAMEV